MAAFGYGIYGYVAYILFSTLDSKTLSPADSALLFAVFWPKVLLMMVFASWLVGLAIRDWHGNVQRMLLLRLLDAQQTQAEKDERVV